MNTINIDLLPHGKQLTSYLTAVGQLMATLQQSSLADNIQQRIKDHYNLSKQQSTWSQLWLRIKLIININNTEEIDNMTKWISQIQSYHGLIQQIITKTWGYYTTDREDKDSGALIPEKAYPYQYYRKPILEDIEQCQLISKDRCLIHRIKIATRLTKEKLQKLAKDMWYKEDLEISFIEYLVTNIENITILMQNYHKPV